VCAALSAKGRRWPLRVSRRVVRLGSAIAGELNGLFTARVEPSTAGAAFREPMIIRPVARRKVPYGHYFSRVMDGVKYITSRGPGASRRCRPTRSGAPFSHFNVTFRLLCRPLACWPCSRAHTKTGLVSTGDFRRFRQGGTGRCAGETIGDGPDLARGACFWAPRSGGRRRAVR